MTGNGARVLVTRWITLDDLPTATRMRGRASGLIQMTVATQLPAIIGYPLLSVAIFGTAYAQVLTDPATTSGQAVAMPYLWIVVVAAMHCTVAATALQVLLVGAAHGVALAVTHTAGGAPYRLGQIQGAQRRA